eukprot:355279-Chlamydomonas_euryale.AAC.6
MMSVADSSGDHSSPPVNISSSDTIMHSAIMRDPRSGPIGGGGGGGGSRVSPLLAWPCAALHA